MDMLKIDATTIEFCLNSYALGEMKIVNHREPMNRKIVCNGILELLR